MPATLRRLASSVTYIDVAKLHRFVPKHLMIKYNVEFFQVSFFKGTFCND